MEQVESDSEGQAAALPDIPSQVAGPHFVVRDDGKLDFAPSEALDREGNNIARLRALHPTLRELAIALCEALSTGNIPHANLNERAQSYRALVDQELKAIPFDRLYVEGVRLQNAATAATEKIAEKELPSFEAPVSEALHSVLGLHGAFMLSTAVGLELIGAEERYKRDPQEEIEFRNASLAFAEQLKRRPDIIEQEAADFVFKSAQEMGFGSNPERSGVIAAGVTKNAAIVIVSAATIGALPLVGGALAGTAGVVSGGVAILVGFEALKKSKSFQAIISMVTKRLDHLTDVDLQQTLANKARALAHFSDFVLKAESTLRGLGQSNQFLWIDASLDWLKIREKNANKNVDAKEKGGLATVQDRIKLVTLSVIAGTRGPQRATMNLDIDGKSLFEECEGNGPVDATFNCIKAIVPHEAVLKHYQMRAVTEGSAAQAEVLVRLAENRQVASAKCRDRDMLVASAKAYLVALNNLMVENFDKGTQEINYEEQPRSAIGKHAGRHAFVNKLEELGYKLAGNQLEDAFVRFKALADRKKHVYDEDLEALVDEEIATFQDHIKLVSLSVIAGTRGPQRATMKLDVNGKMMLEECEGNGPVDAVFNCVKAMVPHEAVLELYQAHAVTAGTDAQAEVSVRLSENGRAVTAKGADPDTLVASAKAYLAALNKLMARQLRGQSDERRLHSTDVG